MASSSENSSWVTWAAGIAGAAFLLGLFNRNRVMSNLKDIQLSENFNLSEFVVTSTGIDNIPGPNETENIRALVKNFLQPLRNAVSRRNPGAKISVVITSGYRSPAVNEAVGGSSKTSQHMNGEAADFYITVNGQRLTNQQIIDIVRAEQIPYDQIIDEQLKGKTWVHGSFSKKSSRRQWLTARDSPSGGTAYTTVKYG